MEGLKRDVEIVVRKNPVNIYKHLLLKAPPLIIGWRTQGVAKLGFKVADFLIEKLGGQIIAEINPIGFFPFEETIFKDNVAQYPECQFWACEGKGLLIFNSDEPIFEHYHFLNIILDFAEHYYEAKEFYTINELISDTAHTAPRRMSVVFNKPDLNQSFHNFELEKITWEETPSISNYLLWIAGKRGISGIDLCPKIPFYVAMLEDPQAFKTTLSFLNLRFKLGIDLEEINFDIVSQNKKIDQIREKNNEVNGYITKLEQNLVLNEEEKMKLTVKIYEILVKESQI